MKQGIVVILLLVVAVVISVIRYVGGNAELQDYQALTPTPTITRETLPVRTSLFVPYWSLSIPIPEIYDRVIYFGVTPGERGINRSEIGYENLVSFVEAVPDGKKSLLTLRMLDNSQNFSILKNKLSQKVLIDETISLAKRHNFDGIVLDLEIKALPFDSLIQQINEFARDFYASTRQNNLTFSIAQYGDTFYRVRPFDVETLSNNSDEIMIMAYDFHKSGGSQPGPNFPLFGKEKYGYDFESMVESFLRQVPPSKITVIFGYFGYDWPINDKGNTINRGAPFSLNEIKKQYFINCPNCSIKRDELSSETNITYISDDNISHSVWFEDETSVRKKQQYLQSKGITSYSYWAHSYF